MPRSSRSAAPSTPPAPVFELDRHLFYWLTQVLGRRDRQIAVALKPYRLRVPEWRALAGLYARQRCSMNELADITTIDRTTLSRTVDRMVRSGWVVRLSDAEDMRVTRLGLSAKGERLFATIHPLVDQLNRQAVAGLPESVVDVVRWALGEMRTNLDRAEHAPGSSRGVSRAA